MTNELKKQISEALAAFANRKHVSQAMLAEMIGVSAATINVVVNNKWVQSNLVSDDMWRKLHGYLRDDLPKSNWKVIATKNFRAIQELCAETQEVPRMVAVHGPTGAGKTVSLRQYSSRTPGAYYILCDVLMTQKSFLVAIAKGMGLQVGGTKEIIMAAICDRLNEGGQLLILDDFGKVADRVYRMLQLIFDRTEDRAGIIIAGVSYMRNYIADSADKDKMGFKEMKRRIQFWMPVKPPTKDEVVALCETNGLSDSGAIGEVVKMITNFADVNTIITQAKRRATGVINADIIRHVKIGMA